MSKDSVPPTRVNMDVPILGQPRQIPPTMHTTKFNGCEAGLFVILDEKNVCIGYQLLIRDPREAHEYIFQFEQSMKDTWLNELKEFPNVGQMPKEVEGNGSL